MEKILLEATRLLVLTNLVASILAASAEA